jgi:hypothetical protein
MSIKSKAPKTGTTLEENAAVQDAHRKLAEEVTRARRPGELVRPDELAVARKGQGK